MFGHDAQAGRARSTVSLRGRQARSADARWHQVRPQLGRRQTYVGGAHRGRTCTRARSRTRPPARAAAFGGIAMKAAAPLEIELTRLTKIGGPLTKQISLSPDGTLV